jgi:protein TonB
MVQWTGLGARHAALVASIALHASLLASVSPAGPPQGGPEVPIELLVSPVAPESVETVAMAPVDGNRVTPHAPMIPAPAAHRAAGVVQPPGGTASAPAPSMPAPADDAPRFTIALGPATPPATTAGSSSGSGPTTDDRVALPEDRVSSPATLARGAAPSYPADARGGGFEGDVPLEIVVSRAGEVESARLLSRRGHGLDEAALAAVQRYRFVPALKDGRPVRVRMRWTVQFRLR